MANEKDYLQFNKSFLKKPEKIGIFACVQGK